MSISQEAARLSSRRQILVLVALVALLDAAVFAVDIRMPPGLAEWLFYLAPVMLCIIAPTPWLPLAAAAASTVLLPLGFHHSPRGSIDSVALQNREIGVGVVWIVAVIASRFIASRNRVQDDRWLKEGQTRVSDAIRSAHDDLPTRVLSEVCRRLGAQSGALFVARDAGPYEIVGGYALSPDRAKSSPKFRLGEGLVGQAARERRVTRLSDVPPGYADISSGLGAAAPRALLLGPLPANGTTLGVIELGFASAPDELCEAYLAAVGETVGAAFQSEQYQAELRALLDKSRAQSEELRLTNEELEQQSLALQQQHVKLEEQQAELEQANHELTRRAEALQDQQRLLEERNAELGSTKGMLEAKAAELERTGRYKSEFLANMSHELRTPLNSALILARLLADNGDGNLTADQVKYAETVHAACLDLLTLINDVLDLSKVEAGKLDTTASDFMLDDLADAVERAFGPAAREKGLRLLVSVANPGEKLRSDRSRLDQILRNLVSNAVKFTERGEVEVTFAVSGDQATCRVRDTGIGVAPEQLSRVFDAFYQTGDGRLKGGTGLGLSIARHVAGLLGGVIDVGSVPGSGSIFTLRVPRTMPEGDMAEVREDRGIVSLPRRAEVAQRFPSAHAPSRPEQRSAAEPEPYAFADDRKALDGARRTVLIIEDDERFAFVLHKLVHELEYQCIVAATGAQGLSLAREHRPDAIVLDVKLPDQSGIAVLDQLKASSRTRHIPVHVLSVLDCTQTALELGAVSYMLKPARREEIIRALSDLAARANHDVKKVLVVEDHPGQREAIHALIAQEDVRIVSATSATEALAQLAEKTFDCVILDLGLPDMSGFDLLEQMASGARFAHPPVIIYTGQSLSSSEEERLQRYARTIVIKGARSPERLLHEVTLFLHKVEDELPAEQKRLLQSVRNRDRALEGRIVLLVDDDVRNVYAVTRLLEEQQARVRIARNGREALDELDRDPEIDVVLMDIMMPIMDGHEAIRRIREDQRFANLPVIALTARAMVDDHERCLQVGANDYLAKPVEVDRLLALLRVWAGRRQSLFN